jgi:hypothetical protein
LAPEPEPFADLMSEALGDIGRGVDVGVALIKAIRAAYERGKRDGMEVPFADELTPQVDLWADKAEQCERPTVVPTKTPTIKSMPPPPPKPKGTW